MIPDQIKTMRFAKIDDIHELRRALEILLDLATKLDQKNEEQQEEIQKLKDEQAHLKGEMQSIPLKRRRKAVLSSVEAKKRVI